MHCVQTHKPQSTIAIYPQNGAEMEYALDFIAIAVAIISVLISIYTYHKSVLHDRTQSTLDAFNILQREAFDPLNKIPPSEIKDIAAHPIKRSDEYNTISGYIARIEHFCVGVNAKIYDQNIVYELAHGYMDAPKLRNRIEPMIDRKNTSADTDYYENIHKVLKWMDDKNNNKCESNSAN